MTTQNDNANKVKVRAAGRDTYLGQECRITLLYHNKVTGWRLYALKSHEGTLATSEDIAALIDWAEDQYLIITDIAA